MASGVGASEAAVRAELLEVKTTFGDKRVGDALNLALREEMRRDGRVYCIGEDIVLGVPFGVTTIGRLIRMGWASI